jgi:hypothetical protein
MTATALQKVYLLSTNGVSWRDCYVVILGMFETGN